MTRTVQGWKWNPSNQDYSTPIDAVHDNWQLLEDDGQGEFLYELLEEQSSGDFKLVSSKKCLREQ